MIYTFYHRHDNGTDSWDVIPGTDIPEFVGNILNSTKFPDGTMFDISNKQHWKQLPKIYVGSRFWVKAVPQTKLTIIHKGGPGSGHRGHAGRKGKVGGSVPDKASSPFKPGEAPGTFKSDTNIGTDIIIQAMLDSSKTAVAHLAGSDEDQNEEDARETIRLNGQILTGNNYVREEMKDSIVSELSKRTGIPYDDVNRFIAQWASTSNQGYASISMQEAFAEELGLELSSWQKKILKPYNKDIARWERMNELFDEAYELSEEYNKRYAEESRKFPPWNSEDYHAINTMLREEWTKRHPKDPSHSNIMTMSSHPDYQPLLPKAQMKQLARAMYDYTQERLAGEKDYITLYRGVVLDDYTGAQAGDTVLYEGNAIESWTSDPDTALSFATTSMLSANEADRGVVLSMDVPRESIVGSCFSGFGCLEELEYIVAGNIEGSKAVIHWNGWK